jgi:hypothetical protein
VYATAHAIFTNALFAHVGDVYFPSAVIYGSFLFLQIRFQPQSGIFLINWTVRAKHGLHAMPRMKDEMLRS